MDLITLDASPTSDLQWDIDAKGTYFLDFGLKNLDPFDQGQFSARLFAVEEFSKRFPTVKKVVLGRINGYFLPFFKRSEKFEIMWEESGLEVEIFSAQLLSEYLHRLASALPESACPLLLCDPFPDQKLEELVIPFCRRRFEHFSLIFEGDVHVPIEGNESLMVALPQDTKYDAQTFKILFQNLENRKFKCIHEEHLNEVWDGVDVVIIEPSSLSEIGERMLLGFEAAGGSVIRAEGKNWAKSIDSLAPMSE